MITLKHSAETQMIDANFVYQSIYNHSITNLLNENTLWINEKLYLFLN